MKFFDKVENIPEGFTGPCFLADSEAVYCFFDGYKDYFKHGYMVNIGYIMICENKHTSWFLDGLSSDEHTVSKHPTAVAFKLNSILNHDNV